MALTINTNIKNDADGYLIDAKNVKGTYVVVANYSELANLPSACLVNGTLAYVSEVAGGMSGFYQYDGSSWVATNIKGSNIYEFTAQSGLDYSETYNFTLSNAQFTSLVDDWNNFTSGKKTTPPSFKFSFPTSDSDTFSSFVMMLNSAIGNAETYILNQGALLFLDDKTYTANLTISLTTLAMTLSFQELQAGSGGGAGETKKWYEFRIHDEISSPVSIANITVDTALMQVKISEEQWQEFYADVLSDVPAFSSLNTPQEFVDFYNTNISGVGGGGTALALLVPYLVDYAMGNQSKCQLVLSGGDGDGITLYPTSNIKGFGGTLSTTYGGTVYNWFDYITGSANSSMSLVETEETIGGGSGGTGSSRTLYHIEVADSNNHKAIIPIYKEAFDKYLVEMNQVGQQMATAMSITWTTLNTIDDVKNLFDTQKSTQLAYGCDLAMNLLVKYAYESGENPVLQISIQDDILANNDLTISNIASYDLTTYSPNIILGQVKSLYNNVESSLLVEYVWFKVSPNYSGEQITIDSNATFTYTEEQVSGGGSSGEGGSVELKSNVYTLKFSSNNTYEYIDSNEETQITSLPMIWGITFEAKDIVNRFNAIIDEFNSTSGTSIAHITSENEIATTIKQMITMMIAGSMNNIRFSALFSNMLVYLANGEEQTDDELYANSLNKLYRMFGTTKGSVGEDHLENSFLANTPIAIVYGMLGGGELVQLDIENTGDYTKFCLKDTYELELINETPFEASGSGSGEPVSGGSGKLYEYNFNMVRYDQNGNIVGDNDSPNSPITRYFKLFIYESNFERFKALASQSGITLNTPQDIVTLINNANENIAHIYSGEAGKLELFLLLLNQSDFCFLDTSYNNSNSRFEWNNAKKILYISGNKTITTDQPNTYTSYYYLDEVDGTIYVYGLNTNNSCTLTEYGTSGSGSGGEGTTQTKTIYEFTLKTSTDGNAIGTDNYNEMYVEISEEKYQEYLTELNALGRTFNPNWQDIHTADESIAFIQQSLQNLPGSLVPLIASLSLLVDYSLKENRNPYANLYYTVGGNYVPYTSYAIAITTTSLNSTSPQVIGGSYTNNSTWWFDIDDMYPKTMLQLSSNSIASYTTRQEVIGGSSTPSEPTIPERFSIAQNLVVNMNGQQYKPNQASWSGSNSDNIRQFKVGSSVAGLTDIQALLSHLTGNPTYDVYNATKPTPCFVFCTESNTCWKLQYDGEANGLRAYKVVNFPFVVKENRYYWHIMSSNDNELNFWMNESAMQYLINAINTIMPTVNPSWVNITDYNGVVDLFNTLKVNASNPGIFVLITTLLGSGGYVIKDNTLYGEKTPIYFTKIGIDYVETREVTGVRVDPLGNTITYADPFGILTNGLITNDSSQASDGVYIDSNTVLLISKQR